MLEFETPNRAETINVAMAAREAIENLINMHKLLSAGEENPVLKELNVVLYGIIIDLLDQHDRIAEQNAQVFDTLDAIKERFNK